METTDKPRRGQPELERFLRDEIARRFRSPKRFFEQAQVEKTMYYRVAADSPKIGSASYRIVEGALDLPRGILDWLAEGRPTGMGSQFEQELWEIYLLPLNDEQRERWAEAIREKFMSGDYRKQA